MASFYIQPALPRPDFRLVISFLWGDFQNVDTDGNSDNPASRDWTELYCQNRENKVETFNVSPVRDKPLVLGIESEAPFLAARVAYFLASETASGVSASPNGPFENVEALRMILGPDFDWRSAERRAAVSCWRCSTRESPYPNLQE